jgi:hypothetical protein
MSQMFGDRFNKIEKTEPAWRDIALAGRGIIAASMVAILLIEGLGYYLFR